jgi:hypothetical protein
MSIPGVTHPRRQPEANETLVTEIEAELAAMSDDELVALSADNRMSALAEVMADEGSISAAHAVSNSIVRRGLRGKVEDFIAARIALDAPHQEYDDEEYGDDF